MKRLLAALAAAIGFAASTLAATVNLSTVTSARTLNDGDIVTGTLGGNYKLFIAPNATIVLSDATIVQEEFLTSDKHWAGLTCLGDATIIIEGTNTVSGFVDRDRYAEPAIFIPENYTLTIDGDGVLDASANFNYEARNGSRSRAAGIGACVHSYSDVSVEDELVIKSNPCGNIVIKGGTVRAKGIGSSYAAIGGVRYANCGDITIMGGTVTATGNQGAGIGSGEEASCGDITISGGIVTAKGNDGGAGIGSGRKDGHCGNIVITGGNITAEGAYSDESMVSNGGAGIGSAQGSCGTIVITGGRITAIGSKGAPGIGAGMFGVCGDITISGGVVTATGREYAAGIGSGQNGRCSGPVHIESGVSRVKATCGELCFNPIGDGLGGSCGYVSVAEDLISVAEEGYRGADTLTITWSGDLSTRTCDATAFHGMCIYGTLPGNYKLSIDYGATVTLGGVTINGVNNADCKFAGITCEGWATINLDAGSTNTVTGFYADYPGIYVPAGCRLRINGGGSLTASSNGYGAGIGGGWHIDCGNIEIEEGSITATGGIGAAGIGGGQNGECGTIKVGAGITRVIATSTPNPIGPGSNGSGGATTIASGLSNTTSGSRRTIIPQWDGNLATLSDDVTACDGVTITGRLTAKHKVCIAAGATVTLNAADIMVDGVANDTSCNWAGLTCLGDATIILAGRNFVRGFYKNFPGVYVPPGCTLTIKGSGSLDADSNGMAAGIGGGYNVSCGNIDIQGGWVYAYGGDYAAGIGGGNGGNCGDINIGAGVVKVEATRGENGLYPIGGASGGSGGSVNFGEGLNIDRNGATWTITWGGDLSVLTGDATAVNGAVIHGTLPGRYKVSIAAGATVTLSDVTIDGADDYQCKWAGLTCEGDATILLEGVNTIRGYYRDYPGIFVPVNKTLAIRGVGALGDGSLHASSSGLGAGIGGGPDMDCGNIYIARCIVHATGNGAAAGIGSGPAASCGNITISSGVVNAAGGRDGLSVGLGSPLNNLTGTISIGSSVSLVKVTGGVPGHITEVNGVGDYLTDTTEGETRTIIWNGDLSKVTGDRIAFDGMKLYKTVYGSYPKISIDDGATVTISNATINGMNNDAYRWAGLTCLGDATIVLEGSNSFMGFHEDYPGIYVPTNKTLTIEGEGSLAAGSNGFGAGIGSGFQLPSGNIVIKGGTITANGGTYSAAGIGGVNSAACGSIAVKGGTVNATGGNSAPGIGALGNGVRCESIAIGAGITQVTATRGSGWTKNPIYDGGYAFADVPDGLRDETSNGGATRTIYSYWNGDLSQLESDMTVPDGMTVYGEL